MTFLVYSTFTAILSERMPGEVLLTANFRGKNCFKRCCIQYILALL